MKSSMGAPLGFGLVACAQAHPLCEAAQSAAERFAEARGMSVEVRCRAPGAAVSPTAASLVAMEPPREQMPRSGPTTWPVRVRLVSGRDYVQQVPLTVAWSAPAWVAARKLEAGTELQPGDLELQWRRWPEGLAVQSADGRTQPSGRLRTALGAGEMLTAVALLPAGGLVRGDRVTAVLAQGAVEVRLPAQLLAPARVGQVARAQASGSSAAIEGRLIDAQTLVVAE